MLDDIRLTYVQRVIGEDGLPCCNEVLDFVYLLWSGMLFQLCQVHFHQ